jgi:dTDP-4-dehydrorhamnose reductase
MRVLVLGASGMLGHKLLQRLRGKFEVAGTVRSAEPDRMVREALPRLKFYAGVDAAGPGEIARAIDDWRPAAVVNCIGIVKQAPEAHEPIPSISVNSLLPHQLHRLTAERGIRLIHFSTDCVFSGRHGPYGEDDIPDPRDLYGRSKLLGEVAGRGALTLRTSIVGRELRQHRGLIEWCLRQRGRRIKGFAGALYSGLTTSAMADLVGDIIGAHPGLDGLWQVSAAPISKFDLLQIVNRVYDLGIEIDRDEDFVCDRRLDSTRLRELTGWQPQPWPDMIDAMRGEEGDHAEVSIAGAR